MTHSLLSAILTAAIEVILIGTGFPRPDPAHAGAATVVVAGDKWFLVDAGGGATINTHIIDEGIVYDDGDVRVTAFLEDHRPVEPAFGYRFETKGKSIVVSGDTRPNENLIKFAKHADVLVMEAYLPEYLMR